jgi:hypothetical protein
MSRIDPHGLSFDAFVTCLWRKLSGEEINCDELLFAAEVNARQEAVLQLPTFTAELAGKSATVATETACRTPRCIVVCPTAHILGIEPGQMAISAHREALTSALTHDPELTGDFLSHHAPRYGPARSVARSIGRRGIPVYGWASSVSDGFYSLGCTIQCIGGDEDYLSEASR